MRPDRWAVVAESDRVQWDCEPLEHVGPLRFGMSQRKATAAMDAQGFASDASAIANFGPFGQVRVKFRKTEGASGRNGSWKTSFADALEVLLTGSLGQVDVVAYFVDSIGLTCVAVDARSGPQVTLDGIRLIGRRPSELANEIAVHLKKVGKGVEITVDGEVSHSDWGMFPRPQRAGDVLLTRAVFGRPNSWAYTTFDCIPADEWKSHRVIASSG